MAIGDLLFVLRAPNYATLERTKTLECLAGSAEPNVLTGLSRFGLKTGDRITAVNDTPTPDWQTLTRTLKALPAKTAFTLAVTRGEESLTLSKELPTVIGHVTRDFGIASAERFIFKLKENYPAHQAGLQKDDHLLAVFHKPVHSFYQFKPYMGIYTIFK